ncbi:MAG: YkgJ family cysteine cluster protein, partial [Candidatus Thorarchaeota archaeon]
GVRENLEIDLHQILEIINNMCTHCGECCKTEYFFLTDFEAPIIAQHLSRKGGVQLIKKHIRENPTVFNRYERYIFHFQDGCPFHIDNRCSIYSDRPMICRLIPLAHLGFFDDMDLELRDSVFAVDKGQGNYACENAIMHIQEMERNTIMGNSYSVRLLRQMLACASLDKKGLAYCFGQPRQRGRYFVSADAVGDLRSWILAEGYLLLRFKEEFDFSDDWLTYCTALTDDSANRLASEKAEKKVSTKTSKRLRHLRKHSPQILEWFELLGSSA